MILNSKEEINNFFTKLYKLDPNISDIFLNEKKGLAFRSKNKINKKLKLKSEYLKVIFTAFFYQLSLLEREIYRETKSLDTSYSLNNTRYRITFYKEYQGNSIAIRLLEQNPWEFKEIGIEDKVINEMTSNSSGLILISGPTSSGKSTTMNSLINSIGNNNDYHIITIENPIEFIYNENRSFFSQREIGTDVSNYEQAIRDAMRSNPNVIGIGEIRDTKSALQALRASQTGHLVISTIHAESTINTIERFIGLFDENEKKLIKSDFSTVLKGIINQRIIKTTDDDVVMIYEHILGTNDIGNKIKDDSNNLVQIRTIMESRGYETLDIKLKRLYDTGKISKEIYDNNKSSFIN